ncbi:MAG: glycosyltransferase family 2 protein [Ignavibacterium sp.]|nr:glycosyltransferase family 2 protein [Ignavibacterium sp.]MDW8374336.1 glycosyltransferase family 2 protein [Ignavibacteriales bacterium]
MSLISLRKNNACAIIPFFNEEEFITKVIKKTQKYVDLVIAIDDGSTDNSLSLVKKIENVEVIIFDRNYGKGTALRAGFSLALELDFDKIITLDADLQHDPDLIPSFLTALKNFDVVIGNRLSNTKSMPVQRILSNFLTSFLLSIKLRKKIKDSQCGFRAYRKEVLRKISIHSPGFEAESEIIVKAVKEGFNIGFIDIPTIYGYEKSKMKSFQTIKGFIKVLRL